MRRYEKYKNSGIAWIGEMPEHWDVFPIKHLCRYEKYSVKTGPFGTQLKGDDLQESGDVIVYNQKNVIYQRFDEVRFYVSNQKADELKSFYTQPDDFLITSRGTIGRAAILPNTADMGILHPCLIALRLNRSKVLDKWLLYFINDTDCFRTGIQLASNATTIEVIYTETLKNSLVVIPSIPEQEQIAKYLDWKCGEVDRIVEVRERQIKLLAELRTSIISRTVTRGLNPNAQLKDSGIDWIGQIPEHWNYKRIKFCVSKSFAGVWGDDASGNKNDVRCYRVADFDYEKLSLSDKNPTDRNVDKNTFIQREVRYNDILIEKSGGGDITPVGRAILVNLQTKAICSNFVHCVKVHSNTHNKFLLYTLHSMYSKRINLLHFNQTTGIQNLKVAEYLSNAIYLPNFAEQQQIANYLDKKTAEIDSTIDKFKVQIDKLKEYRQALITEVVTGKIDVRGIEIPTPKSN